MNSDQLLAQFDRISDAPDAIPRLRHFVHELAFSGKLTQHEIELDWQTKTIDHIAEEITPGFACSKTNQMKDGFVHLRTHNIATSGQLNFDLIIRVDPRKIDDSKAHLSTGDVL